MRLYENGKIRIHVTKYMSPDFTILILRCALMDC